jgi:hypothetical protein
MMETKSNNALPGLEQTLDGFGGKYRDQLYITARTSIYRVKLNAKGVDSKNTFHIKKQPQTK